MSVIVDVRSCCWWILVLLMFGVDWRIAQCCCWHSLMFVGVLYHLLCGEEDLDDDENDVDDSGGVQRLEICTTVLLTLHSF